ncbi:MAG: PilZ domain-containing protein [Terracidiphilus sp.]
MGDDGRKQLRTGSESAGEEASASDPVAESAEASQTEAGQAKPGRAPSMTTVPFEVVPRPEFVFESFLGSLIQLPAMRMQRAQSSEFFLFPVQAGETKPLGASMREVASAASAVDAKENVQEKEKTTAPELLVSQRVSDVMSDQDAARGTWEAEEIEPVNVQRQISEEDKSPTKKEKLSLKTRLQRWLGGTPPVIDESRRRAERTALPGLVAFYWSGGAPKAHEIVNISKTGFYLRTTELWSLETLVRMTLQRPVRDRRKKRGSISVLARVVRIDEGGVGHEFVTTEALMNARSMDVMPSQGTDWQELDRFLEAG